MLGKDRSISVILSDQKEVFFNVVKVYDDGFNLFINNRNLDVTNITIYWVSVPTNRSSIINNPIIQAGKLRTGKATLFREPFRDIIAVVNIEGFKNPVVIMGRNNNSFPLGLIKIDNFGSAPFTNVNVYYTTTENDRDKTPDGSVSYMVYEEGFYA